MITTEELQAWREACEKASCEPWSIDGRNERGLGEPDGIDHITNGDDDSIITADSGVYGPDMPDAEFICLSRTALPRAIAEIERLGAYPSSTLRDDVLYKALCETQAENFNMRGAMVSLEDAAHRSRADLLDAQAERDRYVKVFEAAKAWRELYGQFPKTPAYRVVNELLAAIDAAIAEQEGK